MELTIDEINNLSKNNDILMERNEKLIKTLEEIREIAMGIMDDDINESSAYYDADQIINKINEVLNGIL